MPKNASSAIKDVWYLFSHDMIMKGITSKHILKETITQNLSLCYWDGLVCVYALCYTRFVLYDIRLVNTFIAARNVGMN